jgi:hypothetical protein
MVNMKDTISQFSSFFLFPLNNERMIYLLCTKLVLNDVRLSKEGTPQGNVENLKLQNWPMS